MPSDKHESSLSTGSHTRLDLLVGNYRESREEGVKLAHSTFPDIAVFLGLIGAVIGGGEIADKPAMLLILPFLLAGYALYAIQKIRITSLVTSYMIYLEEEINRETGSPVMLWNSRIISRRISAGRKSVSGSALLIFMAAVLSVFYGAACWWVYSENAGGTLAETAGRTVYFLFCLVMFLAAWSYLLAAWKTVNDTSPARIRQLAAKE